MNTIAEIKLWGRTIGAVALADEEDVASFEYDREFAASGIGVAPIAMPLGERVFRFPNLSRETFHGLPGLLADSLPDKFGNALIDAWLASQGRPAGSFNAVERLCYTGTRGMGALEFAPRTGPRARTSSKVAVERLVALASDVLSNRERLHTAFAEREEAEALTDILRVGTSAGGARAKAVIAWNRDTDEVRSGQVPADDGFEHWLLKFDGVDENSDKELADPKGYGATEYAYYLMAKEAGVEMSECRLFEEGGRRHFMTRRFDRNENGTKVHMQSLGAIAHYDFNMAGVHSYEQALLVARQLELGPDAVEQLFRRAVFNIVARNQDDHVKNIAFLMDKGGSWSLAPAYDVVYAYNPSGAWTGQHQMTLNNKRDGFTLDDLKACAKGALMKRGRDKTILAEVSKAVGRWAEFAETAEVPSAQIKTIARTQRLDLAP